MHTHGAYGFDTNDGDEEGLKEIRSKQLELTQKEIDKATKEDNIADYKPELIQIFENDEYDELVRGRNLYYIEDTIKNVNKDRELITEMNMDVLYDFLNRMEVAEKALYIGLEKAKANNRITDISHAIQTYVESNGYSIPRDYCGHGVGQEVHEDPNVPHYGVKGTGPVLKPGMTICIEPMLTAGRRFVF